MPDANVVISGDASGALAAIAATQAAINALHGKTVKISVDSSGLAGAARDMGDLGNAADKASRSTRDMGNGARGAADHMGRAADHAERFRTHMAAVDNIMRGGGGTSAGQHAASMREVAGSADSASRSMRTLGSGAAEVQRSIGGATGGASGFRQLGTSATAAAHGMGQAGSGAQSAHQYMVGAAGGAQQVSRAMVPLTQGANGVYSALGHIGTNANASANGMNNLATSTSSAYRVINALGRTVPGSGGPVGPGFMGGAGAVGMVVGQAMGDVKDALDTVPTPALAASTALKGVGLAGVVSAAGMGILGAAVAGVGLAGVAEDFAHNNQLMHAGEQAVRGFNKQFSAMRGATSAAGMPEMAGVKASLAGVGHEMASIGANNMGPVLKDVAALGNSATTAMKQLEPAIGPSIGALTALGGAALGALGNSAPAITGFANNLTQNMPGIQSTTEGLVGTMASLANATVDTYANLPQGMENVGSGAASWTDKAAQWVGDQGRSILGGKSISPLSARPQGTPGFFGGGTDGSAPAAPAAPAAPPRPAYHPTTNAAGKPVGNFGFPGAPALPQGTTGNAADIMTEKRAEAGLPPVGQPRYSGVGPRGPGSTVGAMPSGVAGALGVGGIAPLDNMVAAAGAGASRAAAAPMASAGQAVVKHMTKAIDAGTGDAAAAGAGIGAAVGSGVGTGITTTQTVNDTVMRKHVKKIIDAGQSEGEIHSPSRKTRRMIGQPLGEGTALGVEDTFSANKDAMGGLLGHYGNEAKPAAVISMRRKGSTKANYGDPQAAQQAAAPAAGQMARQYSDFAMGNIQAHNDRAANLAAGRSNLHQLAMANVDPAHYAQPGTFTDGGKILGQGLAEGMGLGVQQNTKVAVDPVSQLSRDMQNRFRKDNGINSPSTVYAGFGANLPGGAAQGVDSGTSVAVSSVISMSDAMQAAGAQLSDRGLLVGYTYAQNVATGVETVVKKADLQSSGLPSALKDSPAAMAALAATGFLSAGSGASVWKTNGNSPALVTLPTATQSQAQTFTLTHNLNYPDGHMEQIATRVSLDHLGRVTDAIAVAPR